MKPTLYAMLLLMFAGLIFPARAQQTPDTVGVDYNPGLAGSSWQFSFIQLTDIHIGEGAPGDDYGTPGYEDGITATDAGDPLIRLRKSVAWINEHREALKVHFVVVTGDLSESGEISELLRCKMVLDSLEVPYIPMVGNHDIWPLSQGIEAPLPDGDSLFNVLFSDAFIRAQAFFPGWDDGTRLSSAWDTENNCNAFYQNYGFQYGSYRFLFTDFVSRAHDLAVFNGAAADAQLHDLPGGTWPWLQQAILNAPAGEDNLLIFAHHPLSKSLLSGSFASFDYNEYDAVTQFLNTYAARVGAWIAGHKHNTDQYDIKTWTFSPAIATGYEAAANWEFENGHFRIYRVFDTVAPQPLGIRDPVATGLCLYPNPCKEELFLKLPANNVFTEIRIFDLQGKLLVKIPVDGKQLLRKIDTGALPAGTYLLSAEGAAPVHRLFVHQ